MNARDRALELVSSGLVTADDLLLMAMNYMSTDDVADMLDANELSERFSGDEEPDIDEAQEWADVYGGDDAFETCSYCEDFG